MMYYEAQEQGPHEAVSLAPPRAKESSWHSPPKRSCLNGGRDASPPAQAAKAAIVSLVALRPDGALPRKRKPGFPRRRAAAEPDLSL